MTDPFGQVNYQV